MNVLWAVIHFLKRQVVVVIIMLIVASTVNTTMKLWKRGDTVEEAKRRLAEAEKEQQELHRSLQRVNLPEFVEYEARQKLSLVRPGETVVVLPPEDALRKLVPKEEEEELFLEILPIWRRWVRLFLPNLEKNL